MYGAGGYDSGNYGGLESDLRFLQYGSGNYGASNYSSGGMPIRVSQGYADTITTDTWRATVQARNSEVFLSTLMADQYRETSHPRISEVFSRILQADSIGDVRDIRRSETAVKALTTNTEWWTPYWTIEGRQLKTRTEEDREWQDLSLTFRLSNDEVENRLKPVLHSPGKLEVNETVGGGFAATDRARGANTIHAKAPESLTRGVRLRGVTKYLVDEYEKEALGTRSDSHEVEIDLVPKTHKAYDNEWGWIDSRYDQEDEREFRVEDEQEDLSEGEWWFEFSGSDLVTRRVGANSNESSSSSIDSYDVTLVCDIRETTTIEESLSKLGGVKEREIPDADNLMEDNSEGERQIVYVHPPSDEAENTLPGGVYVATDWETSWIGDAFEVSLTLAEYELLSLENEDERLAQLMMRRRYTYNTGQFQTYANLTSRNAQWYSRRQRR